MGQEKKEIVRSMGGKSDEKRWGRKMVEEMKEERFRKEAGKKQKDMEILHHGKD